MRRTSGVRKRVTKGTPRKRGNLYLGRDAMRRYAAFEARAEEMARRYSYKTYRQDEADDLVQEAKIALAKAAKRFRPDHSAGARFWTFAYEYIKGALEHYMRDRAWIIRSPKQIKDARGEWQPFPANRRWECNPAPLEEASGRDDGGLGAVELVESVRSRLADLEPDERSFVEGALLGRSPEDMGLEPAAVEGIRRRLAWKLRDLAST